MLYTQPDDSAAVKLYLLEGAIGGWVYAFADGTRQAREWYTAHFERVGPDEWVDRPHNARIRRHHSQLLGKATTEYRIGYERLAKD